MSDIIDQLQELALGDDERVKKHAHRALTAIERVQDHLKVLQLKALRAEYEATFQQAAINHPALADLAEQISVLESATATLRKSRRPRGTGTPRNEETAKIRAWAVDNGLPISGRGRIPADVLDKYRAAEATGQSVDSFGVQRPANTIT